MKKTSFLCAACFAFAALASAGQPADTLVTINNKQVEIWDDDYEMRIWVHEPSGTGSNVLRHSLTINHGTGDVRTNVYNPRSNGFSLSLPSLPWNRQFDPHWAGFGIGFNTLADVHLQHLNHVGGISLSTGKSLEYTFNIFEKSFAFARNHLAFVTGLGMRWNRYHLSKNAYFVRQDGNVTTRPALPGMYFQKTRLGVNSFTVPLLLEFQAGRTRAGSFFLSAGVVGAVNYLSTSKVKYVDFDGKKQKRKMDGDLYVNLLSFDVLVQAGFGNFGLYAKYSPVELFEHGRGPEVYPASIGAMIHF